MAQGRDCFSTATAERIVAYKKRLEVLRIPFAKQEIARTAGGGPIEGELSISKIDDESRDFTHGVKGRSFNARETVDEFESFIASINGADVLKDFRQSDFFANFQ